MLLVVMVGMKLSSGILPLIINIMVIYDKTLSKLKECKNVRFGMVLKLVL